MFPILRSAIASRSGKAALVLLPLALAWALVEHGTRRTCCHPRSARTSIRAVEQALVAFQTDQTLPVACPRSLEALYAERYLTKPAVDPWGAELLFTCPGIHNRDGADIVSKGKDGELGTFDDVRNWEP